jgi:hypothetical protein
MPGIGLISLSFCVLSESFLFGTFICNRSPVFALEVVKPRLDNPPRQAQSRCVPILKHSAFLNEMSQNAGDGLNLFIFYVLKWGPVENNPLNSVQF